MIYYGDTHGRWTSLLYQIQENDGPSVILGDVGIGFPHQGRPGLSNLPSSVPDNLRFIRGNHDHPQLCNQHPAHLGDWGYWEEEGIFFVGGGFSIDRRYRTHGIDWWPDEELSLGQFNAAIKQYLETKPSIVISHEGPTTAIEAMFPRMSAKTRWWPPSRTELALQSMWEQYKPKTWVFGHHHDDGMSENETQFYCVGMNHRLVL